MQRRLTGPERTWLAARMEPAMIHFGGRMRREAFLRYAADAGFHLYFLVPAIHRLSRTRIPPVEIALLLLDFHEGKPVTKARGLPVKGSEKEWVAKKTAKWIHALKSDCEIRTHFSLWVVRQKLDSEAIQSQLAKVLCGRQPSTLLALLLRGFLEDRERQGHH